MNKKYVVLITIVMSVAVIFNLVTTQQFFKDTFNIKYAKKTAVDYNIVVDSADGYSYSKYFKINSSSWKSLDLIESGYENVTEFLTKMDSIADETIKNFNADNFMKNYADEYVEIKFKDTDNYEYVANTPNYVDKDIIIEKILFEKNECCLEKDIVSAVESEKNETSLGLLIGYGYYLNSISKTNLAYPNYGIDIYTYVADIVLKQNEFELNNFSDITNKNNDADKDSIVNYISINYAFVNYLIEEYGEDKIIELIHTIDYNNVDDSINKIYLKDKNELLENFKTKLDNSLNYLAISKDLYEEIDNTLISKIGSPDFYDEYNGEVSNEKYFLLNFSFNSYLYENYGFRKYFAIEKYKYDYYLVYDITLHELKNEWLKAIELYDNIVE